jgi:hypothetical protein
MLNQEVKHVDETTDDYDVEDLWKFWMLSLDPKSSCNKNSHKLVVKVISLIRGEEIGRDSN